MGQLQTRGEGDDDDAVGDDIGLSISGLEDLGRETEQVVYDLDEWNDDDRAVLRGRLELLAVPHRWEGASLVVAASDEAWVERILDQVEDDLSLQLENEVEQIAYDLSGWEEAQREALLDVLVEEAVPHGMDADELYVHEIDEQRVDELIDSVLDPDRPVQTSEGGNEVMGELFVAADRLRKDPKDHEGTLSLVDAARMAGASGAPYGVDRAWWQQTVTAAQELAALVEGDFLDDEQVMQAAESLRDRLRPFV